MSYKILPWSHDTNKMVHMLLHTTALLLGSVGIYAAFKFHNESGIDNLYSLHYWVGLGTICLYGVQVNIIRIGEQLEYFRKYQQKLSALVGEEQATQLVNQALVLITLGGNYFVNNYYPVPMSVRSRQYALPDYVRFIISEYRKILRCLFSFLIFFFPGGAPTFRCRTLPWHVCSVLLVYVLAILAGELGFLEKLTFLQAGGLGKYSSEALLVNFAALLVILLGSTVFKWYTSPESDGAVNLLRQLQLMYSSCSQGIKISDEA